MKVLFTTVIILILAGCTTPHHRGGKQHKTSRSAMSCCYFGSQQGTCKCATKKKSDEWETRRKRLGEAVRKGDMTPEEARSKARDMRRKKGEQHPRSNWRKNSNRSKG